MKSKTYLFVLITIFILSGKALIAQSQKTGIFMERNVEIEYRGEKIPDIVSISNFDYLMGDVREWLGEVTMKKMKDLGFTIDSTSFFSDVLYDFKIVYVVDTIIRRDLTTQLSGVTFGSKAEMSHIYKKIPQGEFYGLYLDMEGRIEVQSIYGKTIWSNTVVSHAPLFTLNDRYVNYTDSLAKAIEYEWPNYRNMTAIYNPNRIKVGFADALSNDDFAKVVSSSVMREEFRTFEKTQIQLSEAASSVNSLDKALSATVQVIVDEGHGSGCIISQDGYIVTNYHVVEGTDSIMVKLHNNKMVQGRLIAVDPAHDLSVIKIQESGLEYFKLSDKQNIGATVYAIGSPADTVNFNSLSKGILSGFAHAKNGKLLVTNVGINGGNSGGALINEDFNLIGIVVAKITGFSTEGLGMAIPVEHIKAMIQRTNS